MAQRICLFRICGSTKKKEQDKRKSYRKLDTQPASWLQTASNWLKSALCQLPNIFLQPRTMQWRPSSIWYSPYCYFWLKWSFPVGDIVQWESRRGWWRVNGLSVRCQSWPHVHCQSLRPALNESVGVIALWVRCCVRSLHSIRLRRPWGGGRRRDFG